MAALLENEPSDTDRLDWLDQVNTNMNERCGSHYGWRFECNHIRAAAILADHHMPPLTIRQAIDKAMETRRDK